ncbi:[Fe-Fe] hydrogenase large subunit C-terminal domain-containing protein [Acetomicrobium hydrogeniformans]|nr:[Fe-Fe] hydrogenase large subunit C-terminal domain-containing protein [Acetomicrobium hydrogeniformans]
MSCLAHGVKIVETSCRGCVNCIKSCPTEAMRVIEGKVRILSEICIACGECLRRCTHRALLLEEDEWDYILSKRPMTLVTDPSFCTQFSWPPIPELMAQALFELNFEPIFDEYEAAYDVTALAVARAIESSSDNLKPLISTYCPAVVRLIQIKFHELIPHLVQVESPLETSIDLWRARSKRRDPVTLVSSCPARIAMVRSPVGRDISSAEFAISTSKLAREVLIGSGDPSKKVSVDYPFHAPRWIAWAKTGGESMHVRSFLSRPIKTLEVDGLRNVINLFQEMELGKLRGIDYIEARVCDLGCIGGIGNAESRFLSRIKIDNMEIDFDFNEENREELESIYDAKIWSLRERIVPIEQMPLGEDLAKAMERLKQLHAVYADLPHLDCGTCGRPSCRVMAEDIVKGEGSLDDCIFRLKERIADLSKEIYDLSKRLVHTMTPEGKS